MSDAPPTGVYLAGPVEQDDDPRGWREAVKAAHPDVPFIDPMDWQDEWADDAPAIIQRELRTVEEAAILVCNVGSEAPETAGTHHEIAHALAHGNRNIAVVPKGDPPGFIEHRDIPLFDDVPRAVEHLRNGALAADGGDRA